MKCPIRKVIYITLAFMFLIIGAIGVVLPILPTTPFLLLASFFFARGSERFNKWFLSTKLYKNHLENFVESRSMTLKNKVKILILATTILITAIYLANNIYATIAIACVMVCKYYYFIFNIKTMDKGSEGERNIAKKIGDRRIRQKMVVAKMIEIYCKGNKHGNNIPCGECQRLIDYANDRIDSCPFIEVKTFCNNCKIHCYKAEMREKIRAVMRYSGPRMLLHHPVMVIRHAIESKRVC